MSSTKLWSNTAPFICTSRVAVMAEKPQPMRPTLPAEGATCNLPHLLLQTLGSSSRCWSEQSVHGDQEIRCTTELSDGGLLLALQLPKVLSPPGCPSLSREGAVAFREDVPRAGPQDMAQQTNGLTDYVQLQPSSSAAWDKVGITGLIADWRRKAARHGSLPAVPLRRASFMSVQQWGTRQKRVKMPDHTPNPLVIVLQEVGRLPVRVVV